MRTFLCLAAAVLLPFAASAQKKLGEAATIQGVEIKGDALPGSRVTAVLGEAKSIAELGQHFGAGLTEREVDYLRREEWAQTAQDILWRRTKVGLHLTDDERQALERHLGR